MKAFIKESWNLLFVTTTITKVDNWQDVFIASKEAIENGWSCKESLSDPFSFSAPLLISFQELLLNFSIVVASMYAFELCPFGFTFGLWMTYIADNGIFFIHEYIWKYVDLHNSKIPVNHWTQIMIVFLIIGYTDRAKIMNRNDFFIEDVDYPKKVENLKDVEDLKDVEHLKDF